jgi:hypothetical protein
MSGSFSSRILWHAAHNHASGLSDYASSRHDCNMFVSVAVKLIGD